MTDEKQPFFSHLKELRDRLVVSIIAIAVAFIITYYFKERLFDFLMQPFIRVMPAQSSFIFTGITEAFLTYFKNIGCCCLFLAAPVILYEFWMFVAPGLYENEKKYVYPFIFFGSLCFIFGALFCYFVVMPNIYRFFVSYAQDFVIPMPDLKNYMGLTLKLLIIFGLIFELPLVAFYLSRAGIINAKMLAKRGDMQSLPFSLSAPLLLPDVVSMILIALPLWGSTSWASLLQRYLGKRRLLMKQLSVVTLAAGKGERMLSSKPKVMHEIMGKPMVGHVIERALELSPTKTVVVLGYGKEQVEGYVKDLT